MLGGSKQRALLGLLLLHANRVVSRDRLIDELWNGSPPDTASTALQVYVSQLRKVLGRDTIVTQAPGYLVSAEPGALDSERFAQLVQEAHDSDADVAAARLREALALWRGSPLADLDDSIARPERAELEDRRAATLEQRIDADLELGRHAEVVSELEALVREDPLRERRRAQLMLALYRSGRQAEALDTYRSGRKLLADELGLEPGDELRRLEKAILEQDPAIAAPAPPKRRATPEERRLQLLGRSRLAIALGALLLAAAVIAVVVVVSGNSSSPTVLPNSVAVVDPKSGRVVADVPIGGRPIAIAVGAGAVWVVNADDQTVVRIDPKSRKVAKTIGGLGTNVSDVATGFGSVWVAGGNDGTLTPIDPNLNAPGEPIDLGAGQETLPQPVFEVATGAGHVWITRGNKVLRIDPQTSAIRAIAVSRPQGLEVGAGSAWVTQLNEHVLRFDANTGRKTADEDLSQQLLFPLVYAGSLWLYGYAEDVPQILRLNLNTVKQEGTAIPFEPTELPFGLAGGAGAIWTTTHNAGDLWRVDPKSSRARKVVTVGYHPVAVAVGEGAVWVGVQQEPFK